MPGKEYQRSGRAFREIQPAAAIRVDNSVPFHDRTVQRHSVAIFLLKRQKMSLSMVLAGQTVDMREVADPVWLVSFIDYDLGFFDENEDRVEPVGINPFATKVLPMSSA